MIKKFFGKFIVIFFVVLIVFNTMLCIFCIDRLKNVNNKIESIDDKIAIIEVDGVREETLSEEKIIQFYKEMNDKTNEAIDRILTLVGIVAGIVTFFSLLLAFKAPHDIDKRIDGLNEVLNDVKVSGEEAKYQALISAALAKRNKYETIKKLTDIIHKYPEKPDAYLMRGFMYDDIKKYDLAITEYETAKKFGCDMGTYYNSMGVAYSNKGNTKKAIDLYTKAISCDSTDSSYYCNRACAYDDIEELDKALADYEEALKYDSDCYEVYFNRNFTYDKLWRIQTDKQMRNEFILKRKDDLEKSIDLNPEDEKPPKLMRKFIVELVEAEILEEPFKSIAKADEKIADIAKATDNVAKAFKYYHDSLRYYTEQVYMNKKVEYKEDFNRIVQKIIELILNKNENDKINITENTNPLLISEIAAMGYKCYVEGDKLNAEILYDSIIPQNSSTINLAFMKRRNETTFIMNSVNELLDMSDEKESAVWCINKALCYVDGIDVEVDWNEAINAVKNSSKDIDSAIKWWSNIDIVGEKESNIVFLLLHFAGLHSEDDTCIEQRIETAVKDGYIIPEELNK